MRSINEDEAYAVLEPHLSLIKKTVVTSVNDYFYGINYAQVRHEHSPRSAASICHDKIKNSIIDSFSDIIGVSYKTNKGLFTLTIDGLVVLRFKKFNKKNLSSSVVTQQLLAFNNQDVEQLELPDMPPNGLLHVGYRLNQLETAIEDVIISCRHGNSNIWSWNLTKDSETIIEPIQIPSIETPVPSRRKITAKRESINGGEINANNA